MRHLERLRWRRRFWEWIWSNFEQSCRPQLHGDEWRFVGNVHVWVPGWNRAGHASSNRASTGTSFVGWSDFLCTNTTGADCILRTLDQLYTNEEAIAVFSVPRVPFNKEGSVFVSGTSGLIFEYTPTSSTTATLVQILPSLNPNSYVGFGGGMTFDCCGDLYATNPDFSSTTGAGVETFASSGAGPVAFGGASTVSAGLPCESTPVPTRYSLAWKRIHRRAI